MIETNHQKIAHKLKKRGWDKHSISHSIKILKKGEKNKSKHIKKLDNMIYWMFLALIIIGNAMVFIGVLPILIYSPEWVSVLTLGILGLCVGTLIDILIRHHEFKHKHYINALVSITVMAVLSLFLILELVKPILAKVHWYIRINPLLILTTYIISITLPHIIFKISESKNGP